MANQSYDLQNSPDVVHVASGVGYTGPFRAIEMLADGNLVYTNPAGTERNLGAVTAGFRPIQGQALSASTNAACLVYL